MKNYDKFQFRWMAPLGREGKDGFIRPLSFCRSRYGGSGCNRRCSCRYTPGGRPGERKTRRQLLQQSAANQGRSSEQPRDGIGQSTRQPGYTALQDHHANCFDGGSKLPAHGSNGRLTGGIQQGKDLKADGCPGGEHPGDGRAAQKNFQSADHRFFGDKTGNKGGGTAPIGKAKRSKNRGNPLADECQ